MAAPSQLNSPLIWKVELWPGTTAEFDYELLRRSAIPVKGVAYYNPLRFIEIFGNEVHRHSSAISPKLPGGVSWRQIKRTFFPKISGIPIEIGDLSTQPPFAWRDASPWDICVSFTYNTNAFYRILSQLCLGGRVKEGDIDRLLDQACVTLARLYRSHNGFLLRNINNNFNMYLISKVIEHLVGKNRYDADLQELVSTRQSLQVALTLARDHSTLPRHEKMAAAVGAGVTFIEKRLSEGGPTATHTICEEVQALMYDSYRQSLAIDHRNKLLDLIDDGIRRKGTFSLAVIFDDATETVDDLLWIQDFMIEFPNLVVRLLVNTAQVSINFSIHMLPSILADRSFCTLANMFGARLHVTEMYCPFISFQTNYLPTAARTVIDSADAVYIKGANFFETCQILQKDTFHGFVVFGGVSRTYTGLRDFDRVFAFVPRGQEGYRHHRDKTAIVTLADTCFIG